MQQLVPLDRAEQRYPRRRSLEAAAPGWRLRARCSVEDHAESRGHAVFSARVAVSSTISADDRRRSASDCFVDESAGSRQTSRIWPWRRRGRSSAPSTLVRTAPSPLPLSRPPPVRPCRRSARGRRPICPRTACSDPFASTRRKRSHRLVDPAPRPPRLSFAGGSVGRSACRFHWRRGPRAASTPIDTCSCRTRARAYRGRVAGGCRQFLSVATGSSLGVHSRTDMLPPFTSRRPSPRLCADLDPFTERESGRADATFHVRGPSPTGSAASSKVEHRDQPGCSPLPRSPG